MNADYWIFYGFSITLCFFVGTYLGWRWAVLSDEPEEKKPVNTKAQDTEEHRKRIEKHAANAMNYVLKKSNNMPFADGRVDPNHSCSKDKPGCKLSDNCDLSTYKEQTDEQLLQQCLDEENYELAAVIRDRMKSKK